MSQVRQPPRAPPLICHVVYRLAVGGLENGLVNLVNNLPRENYRHAIICITDATDFRERITRSDVTVHEIHKAPGKDIAAYARMWRTIRRLRPEIVHTRNLPALDMLWPAWLARVPRLVHGEHGLDVLELDGASRKYNRLRRISSSIVEQYVVVSHDLYCWLRDAIGIPTDRLNLVYNGVDTVRFSPDGGKPQLLPEGFAPPGAIIVGAVGRFEAVKNPLGVVTAFCRVLSLRPELRKVLRLVMVGDGSQRGDIETRLSAADARALAWFPGTSDDMPAFYRTFDVYVSSSLREGISNTILEAMACGKPVIASAVGGNPEIMPDGTAGRLVPSGADDEMAAALLDYVLRPDKMRAHGAAARAHVLANFSLDRMVERYDRLYRSLL